MIVPLRALALTVFTPALAAQVSPEFADLIKKEGLTNSQVMQYFDYLTNTIGHRLTGSDNFTRACHWARSEFEKMGLKARLVKWGEWKVVWNRGQWQGRVTKPVEMDLHVATPAWTAGTKGRVQADIVRASTAVLRDEPDSVRGKWIISRRAPRGRRAQELYVAAGVAGVLYPSRGDAKYPRRIRVFGNHRVSTAQRQLVQICIRTDQFDDVWDLVRAAEKTEADDNVQAEFDIRNRFRDEKIELHNVVADLPGTEFPEQRVVVCGHLDSWHQATGTTDNGTGTCTTLEAARILTAVGAKPRRTIRFILWGGEEEGLLGSVNHVKRFRSEMNDVSCVFNHDSGTNWAYSLRVTEPMYEDMVKVMAPVMTMRAPDADHDGPVFSLRKVRAFGRGGGSDHASYAAVGVPAFPWGLKGRADYFRYSWHSQWDTYDAAIPEYQRHTATVVALAALGVANLPQLLARGGVGRAQPLPDARPIAEGRLGIGLDGVKVTSVLADGIAKAAGMKVGDVIVSVAEAKVASAVDLVAALRDHKAPWGVTVQRGGKQVGLVVEPKK